MIPKSDHTPGRRAFFRESLGRLIGPVGDYLANRFDLSAPAPWLRPPGALPEEEFLDTCQRCGACVDVCPADAIFPSSDDDPRLVETPVIDADRAPCVVCDGLECMKACPSGALRLVASPGQIRMGLARVGAEECVRSKGEDCTICVDHCPIGKSALRVVGPAPPEVLDPGCVGCGICQHECPTTPKAVVVHPIR